MNASSTGLARLGKARVLALAALVAAFGMLALAGTSKAAVNTYNLGINKGQMTLGGPFPNQPIIPAMTAPAPWTANPSPNGLLTVDVDDSNNNATITSGNFKIPLLAINNPAVSATPIPVQLSAPGGLAGTANEATGELTLTGTVVATVITGMPGTDAVNPAVVNFVLPGATLSTEDNGGFIPGTKFGANFGGAGALSLFVPTMPVGTPVNGGSAQMAGIVAGGIGELWLSKGVATPPAPTGDVINVNHGKLTLGAVFPDNTIIPADTANGGPYPLRANSSATGKIRVKPDGPGKVKIDRTDLRIPTVWVPKPGDPNTHVPIAIEVPTGLAGDWNSTTGELDLTGTLQINIFTGAGAVCQITAPDTKWSTGLNAVTPGIPFNTPQGLNGDGALSVQWADLPNGVEINGGDCSTVNAVIHDTGAIWFGAGTKDTPPPAPVCEPPAEGLWPDCVEPPKPPAKVEISKVTMSPKKHTTRAGRSFNLQIAVFNKGAKSDWVVVKLKVNRKTGVNVRKTVKVKAFANSKGVIKTPFRSNKKAKGKYTVTATVAGKKAVTTVTVKPVKKKKRR